MTKTICYMQLRSFGLAVGWLELILFITLTFIYGENLLRYGLDKHEYKYHFVYGTGLNMGDCFFFALALINTLTSFLLILGIKKGRFLLLVIWLINRGISLLGYFIISSLEFTKFIMSNDDVHYNASCAILQSQALILFNCFLVYGIYWLLKEIKDSNDQQHRLDTPVFSVSQESRPSKLDFNAYVHQYKFQPSLFGKDFPDNEDTDKLLEGS
ncbi:uncharacterized protein [Drosophila takahashii]|uniref:uncharacterized protein n=1 Tax=Drosophila takahashii TaxID=29030 RepID=UPI001CF863BD|nr:uncharacterized protein LOC108061153 [Drosophila takahashii]